MDPGANAAPHLKVVGLHIEELGPIHRLNLPEDGLGWGSEFPDMVMIGGANGSGKTTLLELIVFALGRRESPPTSVPEKLLRMFSRGQSWIDFELSPGEGGDSKRFRFIMGPRDFFSKHRTPLCVVYEREANGQFNDAFLGKGLPSNKDIADVQVLYVPSRNRWLSIPEESNKPAAIHFAMKKPSKREFIHTWQVPETWHESIEGLLYAQRWADFNAMVKNRQQDMNHFPAYAKAFAEFFEQQKRLNWNDEGELVVEIPRTGEQHPLSDLSTGEEQVIILAAEILSRWSPGSLILIDEPELHLHSHWQAKLWAMLKRFQQDRGGQVIVATQSDEMFGFAEYGTRVILGRENA